MGAYVQGILAEIDEKKGIIEEARASLKKKYGAKFKKADDLVKALAVKKYLFKPSGRVVWIVVGREKEYFIIPEIYCQCDDFYINVVIRKKVDACYHMMAQLMAERTGAFESFEVPDSDFIRLNNEWKKQSV